MRRFARSIFLPPRQLATVFQTGTNSVDLGMGLLQTIVAFAARVARVATVVSAMLFLPVGAAYAQQVTFTSVKSSEPTAPIGDTITFTVTVIRGSSGTPTGLVTLNADSAALLGTNTLSNASTTTFTYPASDFAVGLHLIYATYQGDANFASSVSTPILQTITETVTPAAPTFTDDICAGSAPAGASYTIPSMSGVDYFVNGSSSSTAAGSYSVTDGSSITVTAQGETGYILTGTTTWTHTFGPAPACPQILTVSVTGNGSVSADASPTPQSGGISNCTNAGGTNCSATYATGQSVVLNATTPAPGYRFAWGGDCAIAGSSNHATVPMTAAENCTATYTANLTTTTLTSSPSSSSVYGQSATFTATVTAVSPAVGIPTGTVAFFDGGSPLGTVGLSSGVATFSTSALSAGTHSITAQYNGDNIFPVAAPQPVSNTLTFAVGMKSTTVSLVVAPDHIALSQSITITATVTGDPPTGTVSFTDNGNTLPCSPVTLVPGTTSSTAVCNDTPTGTGSHTIMATYSGDGNYAGATSSAAVVTVGADATAAPTLDRWAMMLLAGLLGAGVFWRLRRADQQI